MAAVWRIAYEIVGDGIAIAEAHENTVRIAQGECFDIAKELGAVAFRPGPRGGIRSLLFPGSQPPAGYKLTGRPEPGQVEATPLRNTAAGKAAAARINSAPTWPDSERLAGDLGWRPANMPMDGYKIYWPTFYGFKLPQPSWWLHIPRMADDGFEPDPRFLAERPASSLMLAMEAHNDAVRALKPQAA